MFHVSMRPLCSCCDMGCGERQDGALEFGGNSFACGLRNSGIARMRLCRLSPPVCQI